MNKYAIPITLVSVVAVGAAVTLSPTSGASIESSTITETQELGYDFDYALTLPEYGDLLITLPNNASPDPVILYSDDSGKREFWDQPLMPSPRELLYKELKAGSYHFVYTSPSRDDVLTKVFLVK